MHRGSHRPSYVDDRSFAEQQVWDIRRRMDQVIPDLRNALIVIDFILRKVES